MSSKSLILSIFMLNIVYINCAWADVNINMESVKQIESGGNPKAFNKVSKARGWYQITPVCLKDYNQRHGAKYAQNELFDPQFNSRVAHWYINERIPQMLKHYWHADTVEARLIAFNAGINAVGRPLPKETKDYLKRYETLTGALNAK